MTNLVEVQYTQTGKSSNTDELGMREMQAMVYAQRNRQHLLVKAPPASGKSRAMMFVALDKLSNDSVDKYGTRDGRTRIIYENGSESDIKFKTLTKNLSVTGYSVIDSLDVSDEDLQHFFTINDNDVQSGTIYVLRSKSSRPEIATIENLYKIGFTVTSVDSRIANAAKEPTYLCAPVEIVATWKVYNVKSSTFEALIHKLFHAAQLQVIIDGHKPQEWFIVPFPILEQAVVNIIKGIPMMYDSNLQQLVIL